ncbi:hypothetical protein BFJ70_g7574 [Fusarium oxysporum]|nr:hypothetical protein BFJ70_g7574 [Fusarium oxysporum]
MTTEVSTDTDTTQVTKTSTEQSTDVVTEQVTKTITTTIDLTSTMDVTDVDTQDVTANVPTTVTVTVTGAAPTTSVGTEYHCAIPGYGQGSYMVASGGAGPSSSWDSCKSFCSVQQNARQGTQNCPTYGDQVHNKLYYKAVTQRKSATVTKPLKVTVTNYKTVVVTNFNTVGVTNRNTIRTTDYDTASEAAYNSVVVINVGYVTVTEYDTVVANDVATNTVIPDAVTVTGGDSYVWGS